MNNNSNKPQKPGNGYGKGTFIDTSLFLSPAFLSLGVKGTAPSVSAASPKMLIMLLGKRRFPENKHKKINWKDARLDDNRFSLTYKELKARGIPQGMATRAFDELLAKGFIKIAHQGGAYDKDKNFYSLIDDYKRWRPGGAPIRSRSKDVVKRGYQGIKKTTSTYVNMGHPHAR